MKAVSVLIAFLFLAACQTVQHDTASGRPEVTITGATVDRTKSAIVGRMLNKNYSISGDTPYRLQFDRPAQNAMAALLLGSRFNATPNERVSFTFAQMGNNVRVVLDLAFVTNPGSGFEQLTPVTNAPASVDYQALLDEVRAEVGRR